MFYPLQALRTFVEVGQRESVKAAAQALHVTPGAVSQQIRVLEDRLGVVLLERERRGMRLTQAGASVYPKLRDAFIQIEQAMHSLERAKGQRTLTISTVATFAASWLVPRLGRFKLLHPEVEVRVEATSELVDLQRDRVEVALRHGLGDYPGLDSILLMAPVLTPVASPEFMKAHQVMIHEASGCLAYPLLHDGDRADWPLWLKAHGVAHDERSERGNAFEDDFLLIRAAEAGQGLALVPQAYAMEEVAAGRLIQVLDKPWPARFAYYAVTRPGTTDRPEVRAFLDWIRAEAAL
ncbi:LysR substrate-binding domain-containing protein [Comamonas sp. JUb58]|uniref:LysR substrate-binding domain-containing protein n=1 Tax=Comamonas sp. JUb58 TaxID=2485114 RepID=UPI00105DAB42|nr:LysR substrate-binding domain-containing protein [Comamonas sp. JUb58]TDS68841.1 LysR family glycine cleavage system transcriptional activator [Comamonas sp. JUb58]